MSHRNEQVAHELLKALSRIIQEELPTERYGLVTITDVVVSTGLEKAEIYVSTILHGRNAVEILQKKTKHIKEALHSAVQLRKIPKLEFIYDASTERVERLEKLSNDVNLGDN